MYSANDPFPCAVPPLGEKKIYRDTVLYTGEVKKPLMHCSAEREAGVVR